MSGDTANCPHFPFPCNKISRGWYKYTETWSTRSLVYSIPDDMIKKFLICTALVAVSLALPLFPNQEYNEFWTAYTAHYGKRYGGQVEEKHRRLIWEKNVKFIINHNFEADMGKHTFRLGMNEDGDLSDEEYRKFLTGFRGVNETSANSVFLPPEFVELATEVDWRTKGYVTPVKDQGHCGSCYAFSATGSLEGQHFKQTGKLISLSEQNLLDCSTKYGNLGCKGGTMDRCFRYIKANGGIDTEASYRYTAKEGSCRFNKHGVGATVTGVVDIVRGSEKDLQKAVATVGPISVAIDVSPLFRFYKTGVYVDTTCSRTKLNHAVLAVGYGEMDGQKYWTVKNSWSKSWGQKGYILMARDKNNMCGIATIASYPLV